MTPKVPPDVPAPSIPSVDGRLKDRILAAARGTPAPVRGTSRARFLQLALLSVVIAIALFFGFDGLSHGRGQQPWYHAVSFVYWSAVAVLAIWGAVRRGRSAVGRPTSVLLLLSAVTPAVLFGFMGLLLWLRPEIGLVHPDRFGFKCFGLTVAAATVPLLGLLWIHRGSDPVHPAASGAAIGVAAGAFAGVSVIEWCPVATTAHIAFGHILPMGVLGALGALVGWRVLAIRARRSPHQ